MSTRVVSGPTWVTRESHRLSLLSLGPPPLLRQIAAPRRFNLQTKTSSANGIPCINHGVPPENAKHRLLNGNYFAQGDASTWGQALRRGNNGVQSLYVFPQGSLACSSVNPTAARPPDEWWSVAWHVTRHCGNLSPETVSLNVLAVRNRLAERAKEGDRSMKGVPRTFVAETF